MPRRSVQTVEGRPGPGLRRASLLPAIALIVVACGGGQTHLASPGASSTSASADPAETQVDSVQLPGRYLFKGGVALDLTPAGDAFIVRDPNDVARGSWTASGTTITFTGAPCPATPGTYGWSGDANHLSLQSIDDPCTDRSAAISRPLDRATAHLRWATTVASKPIVQPGYGFAAIDASGNVWETDGHAGFYRYTKDGSLSAGFGGLTRTAGITVDAAGRISVADTATAEVWRYDAAGKVLARWLVGGGTAGPAGLAQDAEGSLYVALTGVHDHYGEKIAPTGKRLLSWAPDGAGLGQIGGGPNAGPGSIAVDDSGDILLTDPVNNRLVRYDATGGFQVNIASGDQRALEAPSVAALSSTGVAYALIGNEIWEWDSGGTFVGVWLMPYSGDIVVDSTDHLWCIGSRIVSVVLPAS